MYESVSPFCLSHFWIRNWSNIATHLAVFLLLWLLFFFFFFFLIVHQLNLLLMANWRPNVRSCHNVVYCIGLAAGTTWRNHTRQCIKPSPSLTDRRGGGGLSAAPQHRIPAPVAAADAGLWFGDVIYSTHSAALNCVITVSIILPRSNTCATKNKTYQKRNKNVRKRSK